MAKRIEVGVIGLGKFGFALAETLKEIGHDVIGIDGNMEKVRRAKTLLNQVYQADGTDRIALEQIGLKDIENVVVSIGNSMGNSILVAMNLLELGVPNLWVKAISEEHERVLKRLGVDNVIFPEQFMARQLAHRLAFPGLLDYLPLGSGVMLSEAEVDRWDGKTIRELALPSMHSIQIVALKKAGSPSFSFVPQATEKLSKGDILVLLGDTKNLSDLES
ncbi:MAG: TrkA family potassium uptake protein [Proteobacteria bacterium]|nr:TrkA family potassium uptake protein [Pseudomonadota bacterium]MBU1610217.1 TrkA family potassium uptake protein [Pseudomonadota bacterium]